MICRRCVLPETRPDIRLDEQGLCNVCAEYDRQQAARRTSPPLETDFLKLLSRFRTRAAGYDCLVMCSGGKDSTAALYYMKKRYGLNPLAFTFDHGFETAEALENVRNAAEALGVDSLYCRSGAMKEMFSAVLKTGSKAVICHLCSIWYMGLAFKAAARFRIPVIIGGWTKGQSRRQPEDPLCGYGLREPEFVSMAKATKEFLDRHARKNPRYRDFPGSVEEAVRRAQRRHRCAILSPHWFLPFDSEVYEELIRRELNWKPAALSYPAHTTNCALNFVSVHLSLKHFGYTHYHAELSRLIRQGLLTREEALRDLAITFDETLVDGVAQKLDGAAEKDEEVFCRRA